MKAIVEALIASIVIILTTGCAHQHNLKTIQNYSKETAAAIKEEAYLRDLAASNGIPYRVRTFGTPPVEEGRQASWQQRPNGRTLGIGQGSGGRIVRPVNYGIMGWGGTGFTRPVRYSVMQPSDTGITRPVRYGIMGK